MLNALFWILIIYFSLIIILRFAAPYIMRFVIRRLQKRMFNRFEQSFSQTQHNYHTVDDQTRIYTNTSANSKQSPADNEGEYVEFEEIPNKK